MPYLQGEEGEVREVWDGVGACADIYVRYSLNKYRNMKEIKSAEGVIKKQIFEILQNIGYSAKKIILFGSRARKDFTHFSDYDILIITDRTFEIKEKMSLSKKIREYLAKSGFDVDVIIKSDVEVQFLRDKPGSIVKNALKEGVAL